MELRKTLKAPKVFMELQKMALAWDKERPEFKFDPDSPFNQP